MSFSVYKLFFTIFSFFSSAIIFASSSYVPLVPIVNEENFDSIRGLLFNDRNHTIKRTNLNLFSNSQKEEILYIAFQKEEWSLAQLLITSHVPLTNKIIKFIRERFDSHTALYYIALHQKVVEGEQKRKDNVKINARHCCIGTTSTAAGGVISAGAISLCVLM